MPAKTGNFFRSSAVARTNAVKAATSWLRRRKDQEGAVFRPGRLGFWRVHRASRGPARTVGVGVAENELPRPDQRLAGPGELHLARGGGLEQPRREVHVRPPRDQAAHPGLRDAVLEAKVLVARPVRARHALLLPDHLGRGRAVRRCGAQACDGVGELCRVVAGHDEEHVRHPPGTADDPSVSSGRIRPPRWGRPGRPPAHRPARCERRRPGGRPPPRAS